MRKFIFFYLLFLFSHLNCEEKLDFSFALMMNIGENQEKVFENKHLLSLLQWPILPSFSLNFDMALHFPYFHIKFETTFGIPANSGTMKDSDYTEPTSTKKTLFSSHKAKLDKNISFTSLIGVPFKVSSTLIEENHHITIEAEPELGFYFSLKNWHAKDGYTQYKSDDGSKFWKESWQKKEYKGLGIKYSQNIFFPFIAFESKIKIKNKLNIAIRTSFSPLLQGITKDFHFDTKKIYIDSFSIPSYAFEIRCMLEKRLLKNYFLYASLSFFYFNSNNGNTKIIDEDTKETLATYSKGSSGIEGKEFKIIVGINVKLD